MQRLTRAHERAAADNQLQGARCRLLDAVLSIHRVVAALHARGAPALEPDSEVGVGDMEHAAAELARWVHGGAGAPPGGGSAVGATPLGLLQRCARTAPPLAAVLARPRVGGTLGL